MEGRSEDYREALSNIACQARSLLQNFSDSNVQPTEQRMLLDQRPCNRKYCPQERNHQVRP